MCRSAVRAVGDKTAIEWTDATWSVTVGCSRVSPGCDHCYAMGLTHRKLQPAHEGLTLVTDHGVDWTGEIRTLPDRLDVPMRWRKPRRIFVDSMSDLFHADVSRSFLADVFARMALSRRHTFQILTKRPQRLVGLSDPDFIREVAETATEIIGRTGPYEQYQINTDGWTPTDDGLGSNLWWPVWPLPNVWIGTSIESDSYTWRANHVRSAAASVRFLSLEPLLGSLPSLDLTDIDWVIVGGESGPGARPMHPEWVRDLRDRCAEAGIPFLFKQWGSWSPEAPMVDGVYQMGKGFALANDGTLYNQQDLSYPDGPRRGEALRAGHDRARLTAMYRMSKKAAGREFDGRTWDGYP